MRESFGGEAHKVVDWKPCLGRGLEGPHDECSPFELTRAREILGLLPFLRRWVTAGCKATGAARDLSLRQYAALRGILEGAESPGDLARLLERDTRRSSPGSSIAWSAEIWCAASPIHGSAAAVLALTQAGLAASEEVERVLTRRARQPARQLTPSSWPSSAARSSSCSGRLPRSRLARNPSLPPAPARNAGEERSRTNCASTASSAGARSRFTRPESGR